MVVKFCSLCEDGGVTIVLFSFLGWFGGGLTFPIPLRFPSSRRFPNSEGEDHAGN